MTRESKTGRGAPPDSSPGSSPGLAAKVEELPYEAIVERLEQVVARLERPELPLEESVHAFKEGMELLRRAEEKLRAAEKKVEELLEDGRTRPLGAGAEPAAVPDLPAPPRSAAPADDDIPF